MEQRDKLTVMEQCVKVLSKHGFDVVAVPNIDAAGEVLRREIREADPKSISYGDSMTVRATGIIDELRENQDLTFYDGFDPAMTRDERLEGRRQALTAEFFFTGINAVTLTGSLVWRDMIGNRIAPIAFGPRRVVLLVGRNKIVSDYEQAMLRIREIAAPQNIARHPGFNTPCAKTGECVDCNSPQRICNSTLVVDRCFPRGRILVVLIDADLGL